MKTEKGLYSADPPIGLMKGVSPSASDLEADVIVPYDETSLPGVGQFIFVDLDTKNAIVGRVTKLSVAGHLTTTQGDAYLADLAKTSESPPSHVMRQMLRYTMRMQILGQIRVAADGFQFLVGERSFAKLGCPARYPSEEALAYLCNVGLENDPSAVELGHLAYGQKVMENVPVSFSIERLKGKRSFVFARAGYGKSNLIKYLISQLYSSPPDVGLLILDPEGEYAMPDAEGRPGLINVPQLRNRIRYYTNRDVDQKYARVFRGNVFIDFKDFPPQDIVSAFVSQEKQENVFTNYLRSLKWENWKKLVDLLCRDQYRADPQEMARLIGYRLQKSEDVSLQAIKNNIIPPLMRMHRDGAMLGRNIINDLQRANVVIVDISLMGSEDALCLSQLLLHRIFNYNKKRFTDTSGSILRCLAVIEEAQAVLGNRDINDRNVFVRWVKEGRKYNLGCVLVTQQPGAIADQIISQGDNFFVLHLLNESDLKTLNRHNSHFSQDLLSFIRNEPIKGNCYFWVAPDQPFVLPIRVADFTSMASGKEEPPVAKKKAALPGGNLKEVIKKHITEAITADNRVWIYHTQYNGNNCLAVALEYLNNSVERRLINSVGIEKQAEVARWSRMHLPPVIEEAMKQYNAILGEAVIVGILRPVWIFPDNVFDMSNKEIRKEPIQATVF